MLPRPKHCGMLWMKKRPPHLCFCCNGFYMNFVEHNNEQIVRVSRKAGASFCSSAEMVRLLVGQMPGRRAQIHVQRDLFQLVYLVQISV